MNRHVVIVTGESSGEFYGARLAKEILKRWPDVEISGIGGERMERAGVRLIARPGHAFGLTEALRAILDIRESFKRVKELLIKKRPQVIVLIDYPDFNMRVGLLAKRLGIKVLYYVSPQVWAWRKKRRFMVRDISDFIAVILPFEESLYREIGARVEFVGHPVMEEIEEMEVLLDCGKGLKELFGFSQDTMVIALLPGSRPSELKRLIPVLKDTVRDLMSYNELKLGFLLPLAPNIPEEFRKELSTFKDLGVRILPPETSMLGGEVSSALLALSASDGAIAASGTVVLQAALLGVPTVVIYRLSWLTYLIGRLIVDVKYISLPNIILNRQVFPELLQEKAKPRNIIAELMRLKRDAVDIASELRDLRKVFSGRRPSERVSEIVGELAGW